MRSKYPNTLGRIEAVWNKLGGEEGVNRFLRGELVLTERVYHWEKRKDLIYLKVTSDGVPGSRWSERLKGKGVCMTYHTTCVFESPEFQPMTGQTITVVIINIASLHPDKRTVKHLYSIAEQRGWMKPTIEVACLLRDTCSDDDIKLMGLHGIVTMSNPVWVEEHLPLLLVSTTLGMGGGFFPMVALPDNSVDMRYGCAFVVPDSEMKS